MIPGGTAADDRLIPAAEASRTECERLMVLEDGVHWAAYPKHGDQELETEELRVEAIQAVLEPRRGASSSTTSNRSRSTETPGKRSEKRSP